MEFEGIAAWLPSAEDVIIQKLRWSRGGKRAKDIADATQVIRVQRPHLDLAYIRHWTAQHQTGEFFENILRTGD